jgi:hypothetical protein
MQSKTFPLLERRTQTLEDRLRKYISGLFQNGLLINVIADVRFWALKN